MGDRPPAGIEGIDARLRSRFEGGLVLEVDSGTDSGKLELVEAEEPRIATLHDDDDSDAQPVPIATQAPSKGGAWFPSAENVILMWPTIDDLLIEELD